MRNLKKFRAAIESAASNQYDRDVASANIAYVLRQVAEEHHPLGLDALIRECAETFDGYAENHLAKDPPQQEKAMRNTEMAKKCYDKLGEVYVPPMGWVENGSRSLQEHDSAPFAHFSACTDATMLLRGLHEAQESWMSVEFQPDARLVINTLVKLKFLTCDDVTDILGVTTIGREFLGVRPEGVLDLPVEVAKLTGNTAESELAAQYCDGKVAAIDKALMMRTKPELQANCSWEESYQHVALTLKAAADEFRAGLHIPSDHGKFKVFGYNDDRSTGISHATSLQTFFVDVYGRNVKAGWWTDLESGQPKKRNVGELFMLMTTELAEAYTAYICQDMDDKLPEYPGLGVEIGDLLIRVADFCGALMEGNLPFNDDNVRNPGDEMFQEVVAIANRYEAIRKTPEAIGMPETAPFMPAMAVPIMVDAKLTFNATREDHKIVNRLKQGGKRT